MPVALEYKRRNSDYQDSCTASCRWAEVNQLQTPMGKADASIRIGTAGWGIPKEVAAAFLPGATLLERYGGIFNAVEINSSFYRPHRASTYQRWAATVPETFRFSVKVPREITHVRRLVEVESLLDEFLANASELRSKLGPLLVQLPPSLAFNDAIAERFMRALRDRVTGGVVFEPRHSSWFRQEVEALFVAFRIGRAKADPAPVPHASQPGGWRGLTYFRLHGSPKIYYSAYSDEAVEAITQELSASAGNGSECWCIFDNTASGAATHNALTASRDILSA